MAAVGAIVLGFSDVGNGYTQYSLAWTSDASGNVSGIPVPVRRGYLTKVKFVPGSAGTQPTAAYDLTVADADGVDVLAGVGANLSNSVAAIFVPLWGDGTNKSQRLFLEDGNLLPSIANAGNAKTGTIVLTIGP